jgi:hypothetical protein
MTSIDESLAKLEHSIDELGALVRDVRKSIVSEQRRYSTITEALRKAGFNIPAPEEAASTPPPKRTRTTQEKWHPKHHKVAPLRELIESVLTDGGPNDLVSVSQRVQKQRPTSRDGDIRFLMKQMGNVRFLPNGIVELKKIVYTTRNERLMKRRPQDREYKVVPPGYKGEPEKKAEASDKPRKHYKPTYGGQPTLIDRVATYLLANPHKDVTCAQMVAAVKEAGGTYHAASPERSTDILMYKWKPAVKKVGEMTWRLIDPSGLRTRRQLAKLYSTKNPSVPPIRTGHQGPRTRPLGSNTKLAKIKAILPDHLELQGRPIDELSIMRFLANHHIRFRGRAPRANLNSVLRKLQALGTIIRVPGQGWTTQSVLDREKTKLNGPAVAKPSTPQAGTYTAPVASGQADTSLTH